jgi:NAD(P)-dependent dehydrogenase (short-subunit alcohol dehydrogenase family)
MSVRFKEEAALSGQTAIVTGAASGIGRASAVMLASEGARVAVLDVDADGLAATVDDIRGAGGDSQAFTVDLSDPAAIEAAIGAAIAWAGTVDFLVNCAGVTGELVEFTKVTLAGWDFTQAVNLRAPMLTMQLVARHMIERGVTGRIVNLSSSAAFRHGASASPYVASKAGLAALTRVVAEELGEHGINVNAVAPGLTRTGMTSFYGDEDVFREYVTTGPNANFLRRFALAEDVASTVVFLCLPASRQITGQTIHTSAGAA